MIEYSTIEHALDELRAGRLIMCTDDGTYGEKGFVTTKLKELLDAGILTQEEFDAKKKQLLGL